VGWLVYLRILFSVLSQTICKRASKPASLCVFLGLVYVYVCHALIMYVLCCLFFFSTGFSYPGVLGLEIWKQDG